MLETLVESGAPRRFAAPRFLASLALHGSVIAVAVTLTRQVPAMPPVRPANNVVFVATAPEREPVPAAPVWAPPVEEPSGFPPTVEPTEPLLGELLAGVRASGTALSPGLIGPGPDGSTAPLEATAVDQPADLLQSHPPRYPPALAHAGIEGRVELEYVVDTLGRAEPGSFHALMSTHPAFEAAARTAVLASRYLAARLNGRPARQLVRQTLSFRLDR
jgi:TonB family protein